MYDSKLLRADTEIQLMAAMGATDAFIAGSIGATAMGVRLYCRRHWISRDVKPREPVRHAPRAATTIRLEQVKTLAASGKTRKEIAAALGVSYQTVARAVKGTDVRPGSKTGPADPVRSERMVQMYRQGLTLAKIGEHFGVTRERVRQMLKKEGLVSVDGGRHKTSAAKKLRKTSKEIARVFSLWGLDVTTWRALRKDGTIRRFEQQRQSARNRGIDFCLSFAEWLEVWRVSGKLALCGRGKGHYCMSRIKDDGGYELGNVHIQSCVENSREAVAQWRGKPAKKNRGVFLLYPGRDRAWLAKCHGKSIGFFTSEEAAAAARVAYLLAEAA